MGSKEGGARRPTPRLILGPARPCSSVGTYYIAANPSLLRSPLSGAAAEDLGDVVRGAVSVREALAVDRGHGGVAHLGREAGRAEAAGVVQPRQLEAEAALGALDLVGVKDGDVLQLPKHAFTGKSSSETRSEQQRLRGSGHRPRRE